MKSQLGNSRQNNLLSAAPPISRSVGFPRSGQVSVKTDNRVNNATAIPHQPSALLPKALAKRPKGRWFVSLIILSLSLFASIIVWQEFVRFEVYGQIEGRVIRMSPAISGVISSMHVQEGEQVRQGQLLATIENIEMQHQRARLESEMQVARANLEVKLAEIRAVQRLESADNLQREVDYYQLLGELQNRQAELEETRQTFKRSTQLHAANAISETEFLAAKTDYEGQLAQTAALETAVETLRSAIDEWASDDSAELIRGELQALRAVQLRWQQNAALSSTCELRAAADGKIVRRNHFCGEQVQTSDAVFELLESDSLGIVLYFPQHKMNSIEVGDEIHVVVSPDRAQRFRIVRVGDQVVEPPPSLIRKYQAHQALVPVHALPAFDPQGIGGNEMKMRVGAVVGLPRFGVWRFASHRPAAEATTPATRAVPKIQEARDAIVVH